MIVSFTHLFGSFLFLLLIVTTLMVYIYVVVVIVRYTFFLFRYQKPIIRNIIIIMFFLVTMFQQTILTAVGIIWFIIWIIYKLFQNRNSPKGWFNEKLKDLVIPPKKMFYVGTKKTISLMFVGLLLINSAFWLKERNEWVNEKHAYLDAKEYYAVGNVLLLYRAISAKILSPENNFLLPLEWLQRAIVKQGVSLIPKGDAEWAMWNFRFFWYLYIRNTHLPYEAPNPLGKLVTYVVPLKSWTTDMFDNIYRGLDDLANKPMADKVFGEKEKYLAYPTLAMYYDMGYSTYYSPNYNMHGSLYSFIKDKDGIKPLENIVKWLEKTKSEWKLYPKAFLEIQAKPKIQIAQQVATLFCLGWIQENKMYQGTFHCDDPWLLKFYSYSKAFNAQDAPLTKVSKEEQFIYTIVNRQLSVVSYSAHKLCGYVQLKGDYSEGWVQDYKNYPLDGNITSVYQLYYYAQKGLKEQNKSKYQLKEE